MITHGNFVIDTIYNSVDNAEKEAVKVSDCVTRNADQLKNEVISIKEATNNQSKEMINTILLTLDIKLQENEIIMKEEIKELIKFLKSS